MSHSQFHSIDLFILRHAWLNLWDKRMLLAESTRLLSLSCWQDHNNLNELLKKSRQDHQLYYVTVDDTSAHRWSLGACRSSLDYNFADEAIYKADCVSLSQETLLQTRFNKRSVVVSHLMLSCLGFSLTWVNSFWYVRLIWIDILLFATRLPSWIITSSFSLWRDVIGKGM